jgi:hypothetical protein
MAHFAELKRETDPFDSSKTNLVVQRVVVVSNEHVESDEHVSGEQWCIKFFGPHTTWKQTSYNRIFRKKYAGRGDVYDPAKNKFLGPQPFASWSLDANDEWQAPVTYPTDTEGYTLSWDEAGQKWTAVKHSDQTNWNWDSSGLAWVSV